MARSAGYYNVDDFNDYKRKQGKCFPPQINVLAAACHIRELFDAKKFTYGFMGGLPMLCLGYKREMPDLHIAYDDKDFERLKSKLESDRRVRLPTGVNSLLPFKILVWTGPEYGDQGCSINASIEIDLVPSGAYGTPAACDLTQSLVMVGLKTASGRQMVFKSLDIQYLLATLLSYCKARDLSWDPRKDILYLCKNEAVVVQRIRARLSIKDIKEMFLGTSFFSRLHVQDQRLCYRTLLDTEPPPIMAITPPAPQPLAPLRPKQRVSEDINEDRAPRSRYRNASGQRSSSDGTAEHGAARDARPQSMDYLQDPGRLTHIQGVQCVNSAKPQAVSAAAAAKQARKSMLNWMASHNTSPALDETSVPQQQHQDMPCVGRTSSQPSLSSQRQGHGRFLLEYGGGFQPAHKRATSDTRATDQAILLGQRTVTGRTGLTRTDSAETSVQGIQSQEGSLHVVSARGEAGPRRQNCEDKSTSPRGKLHLVGPEGVCGAPKNAQLQAQHQRHSPTPPSQTEPAHVFELDATAPSKPAFVAELPADVVMLSGVDERSTRRREDTDSQTTIGTLHSQTVSAPPETGSLPASLVAGGVGTLDHRQTPSHNEHSNDAAFSFFTRQTNAYRYSTYTFPPPPPLGASAAQALSEEASGPTYKAYRPLVATDQLNRTDSVSSVYSPGHKRNVSHDSTTSHDSDRLAREYQELLNFTDGYGSH